VLGGMFDPVHNGHVDAARYALRKLTVDQLKMIPCHSPNHREAACSDASHRLHMLELATADVGGVTVDPIEINHPGISYAVTTLTELKKLDDSVSLVFVLGIDSFNSLPQWYRWSQLFMLCHFLVLARPGADISADTAELTDLEARRVSSAKELFQYEAGKVLLAEDFDVDISSTAVREKLMARQDVSAELDHRVLGYIQENNLYVNQRLLSTTK